MAGRRRGGKAAAEAEAEAAGEREAPRAARQFTWDERRQLALDVCALAAPDVPGALQLARNFGDGDGDGGDVLAVRELPLGEDEQGGEGPERDRAQLRAALDLDAASDALLQALRAYVDACFLPALAPRPQCAVCQGLWSCGRVAACANDACGLRVHEECFGVLLRERGDAGPWRCPSCLLGRELLCAVCMQAGGALKPLATAAATAAALGAPLPPTSAAADAEQKWVHVLCALAIPELLLRDVPTMEPVDGFDEIENGRFRYLCSVCRKRGGASVICEHEACNVGMHPQCAADAGLMIGTEDHPTGVFCEKHLPLARVPGATRWISDEDLVEEIMSEYSLDEDLGEDLLGISAAFSASPGDRYAFILESTPFLARKLKLFGRAATSRAPPAFLAGARLKPEKVELAARDVRAVHPSALAVPSSLQNAVKKQQAPVFPPRLGPVTQQRLGLPPFPQREAAVGAIVEYFVKEQDAWERARVLQWDTARAMHLVQLVRTSQRLYATLSSANTLVLYLPDEENLVDGVRVKLYRPWTDTAGDKDGKDAGASPQWRPKPRQFAASTSG
jgi:NuA3 HAT complex component NTO1